MLWYQLLVGDVTREMAHGWARELEVKFAVPARHIRLIEQCVGWIEERPRDAGALLPFLRQLQEPAEPQTTPPVAEPCPAVLAPAEAAVSTPPGQSPEIRPVQSSVPPADDGERTRQIRFVTILRQLVKGHETVARLRGLFWPLVQGIVLGMIVGLPLGSGLGAIVLIMGHGADWSHAVTTPIAILVNVVVALALWSLTIRLRLRFWWKAQARAELDLAARIDQMLTAFPQECQIWGGRAALLDRAMVEAMIPRPVETR